MTKEIRVYPDPNHSIRFNRYANVHAAINAAKCDIGLFGENPSKVRLFTGEGWSIHMRGPWGRVVVTGDFVHMDEVNKFMMEVTHA